jgi:hypothetical protein
MVDAEEVQCIKMETITEQLDIVIDAIADTSKGGVIIQAIDRNRNRRYRILIERNDYNWLVKKKDD